MNEFLTEYWQEQIRLAMVQASTDPGFRQKLIAQPRETLSELAGGIPVPEGLQLLFVNQKVDAVVLQLPAATEEIRDPTFKFSWILCTSGVRKPGPRPLAMLAAGFALVGLAFLLREDLGKPQRRIFRR